MKRFPILCILLILSKDRICLFSADLALSARGNSLSHAKAAEGAEKAKKGAGSWLGRTKSKPIKPFQVFGPIRQKVNLEIRKAGKGLSS
jgi:hypothetical protein